VIWRDLSYFAATLADGCAARSRSSTVLHPLLRLVRCLIMHAVIFEMLGISELHSRIASPVHICCASALKAKLEVGSAQMQAAKANAKPAWRRILMLSLVMVGFLTRRALRPRLMPGLYSNTTGRTVMRLTQRNIVRKARGAGEDWRSLQSGYRY
jgi:hypothetical protein